MREEEKDSDDDREQRAPDDDGDREACGRQTRDLECWRATLPR